MQRPARCTRLEALNDEVTKLRTEDSLLARDFVASSLFYPHYNSPPARLAHNLPACAARAASRRELYLRPPLSPCLSRRAHPRLRFCMAGFGLARARPVGHLALQGFHVLCRAALLRHLGFPLLLPEAPSYAIGLPDEVPPPRLYAAAALPRVERPGLRALRAEGLPRRTAAPNSLLAPPLLGRPHQRGGHGKRVGAGRGRYHGTRAPAALVRAQPHRRHAPLAAAPAAAAAPLGAGPAAPRRGVLRKTLAQLLRP